MLLAKKLHRTVTPHLEEQPPTNLEQLQARLEALEEKCQLLGGALNQNTEVFASAYEAVDRRMYTIMRVLNEMHFKPSKLHTKVEREVLVDEFTKESFIHGGRVIDWMQYFVEFDVMLALVKLAETHCSEPQTQEEQPDNVVIFGGGDQPNG